MGKIVAFSQLKSSKNNRNTYLDDSFIVKYQDMLDGICGILDLLYSETESFLRENRFPIKSFKLDEESVKRFLAADYAEAYEGGEEELSISYEARLDNTVYKTLAVATIEGDQVETDVSIYKKAKDNEWLIWNGGDNWIEGPGKDFF